MTSSNVTNIFAPQMLTPSTAECGVTDTDRFERMQKIEGRERAELHFSEDLQTLLFGPLCLAAQ